MGRRCKCTVIYSIRNYLPIQALDFSWQTLSGNSTSYIDTSVVVGSIYEYRVVKTTPLVTGYGYLYTGINVSTPDDRVHLAGGGQ